MFCRPTVVWEKSIDVSAVPTSAVSIVKKVLCCAAFSLWRFSVCLIFKQSTNVLNPKCGIAEIASCSKPFLTCCRKAYCPHSSQFGVKTVAVSIPDMPWCCHRIHIGEMILSFPCRSDCHMSVLSVTASPSTLIVKPTFHSYAWTFTENDFILASIWQSVFCTAVHGTG